MEEIRKKRRSTEKSDVQENRKRRTKSGESPVKRTSGAERNRNSMSKDGARVRSAATGADRKTNSQLKKTSGGSSKQTAERRKRLEEITRLDEIDGIKKNNRKKSSGKETRVTGKAASLNCNKKRRNNRISRNIGLGLVVVQVISTIVFMVALLKLGMFPEKYLVAIAALLGAFALIAFAGQFFSKKKAIAGKVFSGFMSIILIIGSSYIFKTVGAIGKITGGNVKMDNMVVAVLADDNAENIQDAAGYNFGVQYTIKGDDVRQTVSAINEEVGAEIQTTEYTNIQEQAERLHDGSVDAIILNEAYSSVLEEEFGEFESNVKIIYSHEIKTEIVNAAENVEVEEEAFIVYISGIDVYGSISKNSRSDVNILAVVNPSSHQILLVTTPRDYYVPLTGISGGVKDKLTHAGIYGVDVSMATLADLYGTEAEFYARVNFTSLIQMVDALGGVDVYSEYAFTTDGGELTVKQGVNHLNGKQALAFSRERHNVPGGDFQRGKNQQAVITAMIQKAISPAILTSAGELLETVSGNVDTNMSQSQIQKLIKSQLSDPQPWKIKSMAAEGTGSKNYCYSMPSTLLYVTEPNYESISEIAKAIEAVRNGETFEDSTVAE